jgi:exosortase C (VPDSG-CTERM-specific)
MSDELVSNKKNSAQLRKFFTASAVLAIIFILPLWHWTYFAATDELSSYVLLIPFVSFYLASLDKKKMPADFQPASALAMLFFVAGFTTLIFDWFARPTLLQNQIAVTTLAFVLFWIGIGFFFLGRALMRFFWFSFALLIFMVPFPIFLRDGIETALQHGSAIVAAGMFHLSGLPIFRTGMVFKLPGMTLEVAPECSGIHSTIVLFITSLVAGQMILRRAWTQATLALAVIPLALLRNGFRVFVIGQLCVHVGPQMIDSPIHRRGGPIFFALSLIPFFFLLYYLKKTERNRATERPLK